MCVSVKRVKRERREKERERIYTHCLLAVVSVVPRRRWSKDCNAHVQQLQYTVVFHTYGGAVLLTHVSKILILQTILI